MTPVEMDMSTKRAMKQQESLQGTLPRDMIIMAELIGKLPTKL